jgi:tetratricopeptide (TPR) repeat protein
MTKPFASPPLFDQGLRFLNEGHVVEAERIFRKLVQEGSSIEAKKMHAIALGQLGRIQESLASFDQILSSEPVRQDIWFERGLLVSGIGRLDWAGISFEKACQNGSEEPNHWLELGNTKKLLGKLQEAESAFTKSLQYSPASPEALNNRGTVRKLLQQPDQALADFSKAIDIHPAHLFAYFNRGALLSELNRPDLAQVDFERAISIAPGNPNGFHGLGEALHQQGRHEEALLHLEAAVVINPTMPQLHLSTGNCLQAMGLFEEAIIAYAKAIEADPNYAEALINWSTSLQELGRHPEAIKILQRALELRPGYAGAQWNMANSMLCLSLDVDSWRHYEKRHVVMGGDGRKLPKLPVLGEESPKGKKLLLHWDQRFGDIIQVLRYVPMIESVAAQSIWQIAPSLQSLVSASFPDLQIVDPGVETHGMAYRLPITSLPLAMKTFSEREIPREMPYLRPSESLVQRWKVTIHSTKPKIGLVWRGQPSPPGRSVLLRELLPIIRQQEFSFYSLQHGADAYEVALLARYGVQHFGDVTPSFEDTAAVIQSLDLVITIDTSVAHLAGALGKPCWVLLKFGGDWRWHLEGSESAWYPSARIYRQRAPGDWGSAVREVSASLANEMRVSSES